MQYFIFDLAGVYIYKSKQSYKNYNSSINFRVVVVVGLIDGCS
jgi:hypothetical protein